MLNTEPHELAGQTVKVNFVAHHPQLEGTEHKAVIEDYWDRITGKSWMYSNGNPAALVYGLRSSGISGGQALPLDDKVVYAKIGESGHLIHESELVKP